MQKPHVFKTRHQYYAQIQEGMGVSGRQRTDCYSRNMEDLHIERIYFYPIYWNDLESNLLDFCLRAVVPESQVLQIVQENQKRKTTSSPSVL